MHNNAAKLLLVFQLLISHTALAKSEQILFFSALGDGPKYVLKEAYSRLNIAIKVKLMSGERALWMANEGIADGDLIRIANIHQRYPNLLMVPTPVFFIEQVAFTKKIVFPVNGWESLSPYHIGTIIGMKVVEDATKGMNVVTFSSYQQVLQSVHNGQTDIGVLPRINTLMEIKKLQLTDINILEPSIMSIPLYHYLHNKHKDLLPKLEQVLQTMEKEGMIKKLIEKFITEALN